MINQYFPVFKRYNILMFYTLMAANVLMVAVFLLKLGSMPPQIPLFYTHSWGETQIADFWMIFLIPALANTLFFVNDYFYKKFFVGNELVKKIFEYINVFLIASFTLIFIKIIFLVS